MVDRKVGYLVAAKAGKMGGQGDEKRRANLTAATWVYSMAALSVGATVATRVEANGDTTAVSLAAWWVEMTDCEKVVALAAVMAEMTDSTMVVSEAASLVAMKEAGTALKVYRMVGKTDE